MTGGQVRITGSRLSATNVALSGNGMVDITNANLDLVGCTFERGVRDHRFVYAAGTSTLNITGCKAFSNAGITFTKPAFHYDGTSTGAVTGAYTPPKGGGTGSFITVAADNGVTITGVVADGWTFSGPTARAKTVVTNNVGFESDQFAGCVDSAGASNGLPAGWTCSRLATGNYSVTHSLGLSATRDMVFIPTGEAPDAVAAWEVTNSTTAAARIRTTVAGVAADTAFSFIARRRR